MKIKHIFSLAALALMTAACSSDENTQSQSAPIGKTLPFRAVITAGTPVTRGLTEGDKTISAAWVKDEEVALVYGTSYDIMTVESVDDNGVATITGTVSGSPQDGDDVVVVYCGTGTTLETLEQDIKGAADDEAVFAVVTGSDLFKSQSGTFAGINSALDLRISSGAKFAVSNGSATLSETTKLTERFAIWKLGLTDGTDAISADELTVEYGTSSITAKPSEAASTIYLAVEPTSEKDFGFTAKVSEDEYTYSAEKVTLAAGKFYTSNLTMTEVNNKYLVYDSSGQATETDIPSDATTITSTTTTWAKGTYVVSEDVTIAGDVTLSGDVNLILMDGVTLTVSGKIDGGQSITIYGQTESTGKLSASGGDEEIAILAKNLTVHGGVITVPEAGQGIETGGVLTVYNGTINTTGTLNGFMILGGMYVYGGEVTATSTDGAAISLYKEGSSEECDLTIAGGKVTANSTNGQGIFASDENSEFGKVIISGGTVNCTSGGYGIESMTSITISGGEVTATSTGYDGVGMTAPAITISGSSTVVKASGEMEGILNSDGTITIEGGDVTATAVTLGEKPGGIGIEAANIIISGGDVKATGGDATADGAAGGAGIDGALTVNGGTVTAIGGNGADSSEGNGGRGGHGIQGNVSVTGGTVTATGGNGGNSTASNCDGGSGGYGVCGTVTDGTVTATGGSYGTGGEGGGNGETGLNIGEPE